MTASPGTAQPRPSFLDALAVYLKPRVLIVLFLGFSSGLPLALSGATLLVWMREVGVDLGTIGLFALVGTPYTVKFLWAPLTDALDVPLLSRWLGRRRGWLVFTQMLLMAAIVFLGSTDPARAPGLVALGALLVATASATQDIVVDAFRVESLPENEQAAGMASYVAAYRIGMLVSTAGALFLVSAIQAHGFDKQAAWHWGYVAMAVLVLIGTATALIATEPERSVAAEATHAGQKPLRACHRSRGRRVQGFSELRDGLHDAGLRGAVQVHRRAVRRHDRALRDRSRLYAQRICGDRQGRRPRGAARRRLCRRLRRARAAAGHQPVDRRHPAGGGQSRLLAGPAGAATTSTALTFAITLENFTSAIGTVMFVAYLSALCQNPLHTATQYALLTALAAVGRTYLSSGAGFIAEATGWVWFFVICALAGLPSLVLLAWLQRTGHFKRLEPKTSLTLGRLGEMPPAQDGVADMPGRFRAEKCIGHHRDLLAKQPVEPRFLRLVVHHHQMEGDRRRFRIAEVIVLREFARVIRRDLVDVDPACRWDADVGRNASAR